MAGDGAQRPAAPARAPRRLIFSRHERHRYGSRRGQVAELWRPDGDGPAPVVVLIHGGYWRAPYTKRLMHALARALRREGWAVWNIEYRRVGPGGGGGGWPATFLDVAAAADHLWTLADPALDLDRIVPVGHSAGGHLALWLAARPRLPDGAPGAGPFVTARGVVSLAGVGDLLAADRQGLGAGAARALLGASPEADPGRWRLASPAALAPIGVPQVLIHGTADTTVPLAHAEGYRQAVAATGDRVALHQVAGVDHLGIIRPSRPGWPVIRQTIASLVGPGDNGDTPS